MKKFISRNAVLTFMLTCCFALLVSSCDKTVEPGPVDTTKVGDYMPIKTGSYWVYNRFEIDTNGSLSSVPTIDSMFVADSLSYKGRIAYRVITINSGLNTRDTSYWSVSNTGIQAFRSLGGNEVTGGAKLPVVESWITLRGNQTSWTSLDTNISNVSIPFSGTNITAQVSIKVLGVNGTDSTIITGNGTSLPCIRSTINYNTSATTQLGVLPFNSTQTYFFSKDVGMTRLVNPNVTVNVFGLLTIKYPGYISQLQRYKL